MGFKEVGPIGKPYITSEVIWTILECQEDVEGISPNSNRQANKLLIVNSLTRRISQIE